MKRPWNIIDCPVYSLATYDQAGKTNMNIATYVTAVSMKPKLYAISLYHGTKTLENIKNSEIAVLQLLSKEQIKLLPLLGKKSGFKVDKEKKLSTQNWLTHWKEQTVLDKAAAYLLLEKISYTRTGDHDLYVFGVKTYRSLREDVLQFRDLIEAGLIL